MIWTHPHHHLFTISSYFVLQARAISPQTFLTSAYAHSQWELSGRHIGSLRSGKVRQPPAQLYLLIAEWDFFYKYEYESACTCNHQDVALYELSYDMSCHGPSSSQKIFPREKRNNFGIALLLNELVPFQRVIQTHPLTINLRTVAYFVYD